MNIIELMQQVGITSPDGFKLTVNPVQIEKLQAFAAAVIAEHTAELIEGVGEPVAYLEVDGDSYTLEPRNVFSLPDGEYRLHTAAQVAGAVAKARKDAYQELLNKDWTEIMREGALVTWGDAETLGDRVVTLIQEKQGGATC